MPNLDLKILIILLVVISTVYSVILNLFKRRSATNPIPDSVKDVYDDESYEKWRAYNADHSRLDLISSLVSGIASILLLVTNAYSAFASLFPADWFGYQVLAVIFLDTIVGELARLGFSYYSTFAIEEKYGFNKSTNKTFVIDKIRGFIVNFLLMAFLAMILALLHMWLGDALIILFTVVMFLFGLLISFLYPILSRIGNKFISLEDGELRTRLTELLESHGYKVRDIKVMDASRRTTKLNAYFTGFGSTKTIVLFDNLVNAMTPDEICAVFAHELGHGINKDTLKMQIMNIGNFLIMAILAWVGVSFPELHHAFGFTGINYGFAIILVGIFLAMVNPFSAMVINAYSRKAEYRADRQAVLEGYGEAMIMALKKLAKENFAELAPTRISVLLEYSHPPLAERINAVNSLINDLANNKETLK